MNFPYYIARRYLFTKSSNNAINFITFIAAFGIVIGSAALFVVLSGFAGLKDFTLQFSSFVDPDLKVVPAKGKSFTIEQATLNALAQRDDVASFSKIIEERVIVNFEDKNESVQLRGVDTNYPTRTIDSIVARGQWFDPEANEIVSGWGIANNLGFGLFDFAKTISVYVPKPGKGQVSSVRSAFNSISAVNVGVFQINEDLDHSVVYTSIDLARGLLSYEKTQLSAIEIILKDGDNYETSKTEIAAMIGEDIIVKDRVQLNDALYKMLNTENLAVYLIFTLVMIIALFNVIGSIIMMILDKKKNLKTLFNLGVTLKDIRGIFFLQGSMMSVFGGVVGLALGGLLIWFQDMFEWVMITPTLPYPVSIKAINFVLVFVTISVLGILASKLASSRITSGLILADQTN